MFLLLALLAVAPAQLYRAPVPAPAVETESARVWVRFTDKGIATDAGYRTALARLEAEAGPDRVARRASSRLGGFDFRDLPVNPAYVRRVERLGGRLRHVSNWLNAASFDLPRSALGRVRSLASVHDITPVVSAQRVETDAVVALPRKDVRSSAVDSTEAHRFYGPSFDQAWMMGVPDIFFRGFFGSGVRLAIFDTGLKLNNVAVENLRIADQYDFLSGDHVHTASAASSWTPQQVPGLDYLGLAHDPVLFYSPASGPGTLFQLFVADSFSYAYQSPRRAVHASLSGDFGATWTEPVPLVLSQRASQASFHSFENLNLAADGPVSYLVYNDIGYAYNGGLASTVYLLHHLDGNWRSSAVTVEEGRYPDIAVASDTLWVAYVEDDSLVTVRTAAVSDSVPDPAWLTEVTVSAGEELAGLELAVDGDNVTVVVLGLKTGRVLQFRCASRGNNIGPAEELVASGAFDLRLAQTGRDLYLGWLDTGTPPWTRLSLLHSGDMGGNWEVRAPVTDSSLSVGSLALLDHSSGLHVWYDRAGSLYRASSPDNGATWQPATLVDTVGFCSRPSLAAANGNVRATWLRRGDDNTVWEAGDTARFSFDQPDHGTRMASIIAGYQPGGIVGIAPGVDLLIAKTEFHKTRSGRYYEYDLEEDTYVEAIEWAEEQGADIISTSLGYRGWYTDEQFDGRTAPVSIAASLAAERGLVIVTAMGNRDTTRYPLDVPYITAPADAEGVVSAGGVERNMLPWRGTGTGPTSDGRCKPELVALSDTVAVTAPDSIGALEGSVGTSCATALIAGAFALLKEAHPSWSAESLKQVLFSTATRSVQSCTFGFGVPRVDSAFALYPPEPGIEPVPRDQAWAFPNPFVVARDGKVLFGLDITRPASRASISIFTVSGTLVDTIRLDTEMVGRPGRYTDPELLEQVGASWDGTNAAGEPAAAGLYLAVLETTFGEGISRFALVR